MKIRTQLLAAVAFSVVVGVLAAIGVAGTARDEDQASSEQSRAQETAHEVSGLLVLTQEYARHADDRAAQQWRSRHGAISATLARDDVRAIAGPALKELRGVAQSMPLLFDRLEDLAGADDDFSARRKEVLLDQLLTSTQAMSDYAHQWYQEAAATRQRAETRFQAIALATPLVMLLLLATVAGLVVRRVLRPLDRFVAVTAAVARGDLSQRLGGEADNELGELARRFDDMSDALTDSRERQGRAEKQLRTITDNVPALVAYIDDDEVYRYTNAHYGTLFGVEPGTLIGRSVAEGMGAEQYAVLQPRLRATLDGQRTVFERSIVSGGREVHLLTTYIPDLDDAGRVIGLFAMAADVSAVKHAELQLRQSERRVRDITEHLPALVGQFDREQRCLFANRIARDYLGLDAAQIGTLTFRAGVGEISYAQHEPHIRRALEGQASQFEGHIVRKGRDVHFQVQLVPQFGEAGNVQGFYAMTFDVTAVRQAERAHARSEERLRQITDNLPVMIGYLDHAQRLQFANATYRDWLGVDLQTALGRPVVEVVGEAVYAPRRPHVERALAGQRTEFEQEIATPAGVRCLRSAFIPDFDDDGSVRGLYALSTDVTAQKETQRQLQALARFDTLTGLPNRLQYGEKLPEALARAERSGHAMALMFLDVDHFKSINDSLGHAAGDAVLKEFAVRLKACVRQTDTVARLAGDEFVVILEDLHHESEAQAIAQKLLDRMAEPFQVAGRPVSIGSSIGIGYAARTTDAGSGDELLALADAALYDAKSAGRNTFRLRDAGPRGDRVVSVPRRTSKPS